MELIQKGVWTMKLSKLFLGGLILSSFLLYGCEKAKIASEEPSIGEGLVVGEELSSSISLHKTEFEKTSMVVVVPAGSNLTITGTEEDRSKVFIPSRTVEINPFAIGRYEVTQELYTAVMGKNPSGHQGDNRPPAEGEKQHLRPVEEISWYDAILFCNELTKLTLGEKHCVYYGNKSFSRLYGEPDKKHKVIPFMHPEKKGYRLPIEIEWELAARGGNPEDVANWDLEYAGSNTIEDVTWYNVISLSRTHEVGIKAPNSLGLYDMSGNVWEWCWDWFGTVKETTPSHGLTGPSSSGAYRVYRGGSWGRSAPYCTVTTRSGIALDYNGRILGLRLARSL